MSKLRPECQHSKDPAISDETALFLIRDAVARRRALIHGRLDDGNGHHCAMGAFWEDNPKATVNNQVIDEVAAVNDSLGPKATAKERWQKVNSWLRWKLRILSGGTA